MISQKIWVILAGFGGLLIVVLGYFYVTTAGETPAPIVNGIVGLPTSVAQPAIPQPAPMPSETVIGEGKKVETPASKTRAKPTPQTEQQIVYTKPAQLNVTQPLQAEPLPRKQIFTTPTPVTASPPNGLAPRNAATASVVTPPQVQPLKQKAVEALPPEPSQPKTPPALSNKTKSTHVSIPLPSRKSDN